MGADFRVVQGKASPDEPRGSRRPAKGATRPAPSARDAPADDDPDELFVDPEPSKRPARAADRRRQRGQALPEPVAKDTHTALPRHDANDLESLASVASNSRFEPDSLVRGTLVCVKGPEEGLSLKLIEGTYTIGRARENNFVLKDIAASRRHLRIEVEKRGVRAVDLGSGNGTRINGRKLVEHALSHGDRIEIGASVLVFEDGKKRRAAQAVASVERHDAHAQVNEAAALFAAELSEKAKADDDSEGDPGPLAQTRGPPGGRRGGPRRDSDAQAPRKDDEAAKPSARNPRGGTGRTGQARTEKLWKETFTNLPLDEIVPANEPLRGQRIAETPAATPAPAEVQRAPRVQRPAVPRPAPLPTPAPRDAEAHGDAASSLSSFILPLALSALAVVIVGGAVAWISRDVPEPAAAAAEAPAPDVEQEYARAIAKAQESFAAGDWVACLEYSTAALQLRPKDPLATTYQRDARARLQAPPPADPPASPQGASGNAQPASVQPDGSTSPGADAAMAAPPGTAVPAPDSRAGPSGTAEAVGVAAPGSTPSAAPVTPAATDAAAANTVPPLAAGVVAASSGTAGAPRGQELAASSNSTSSPSAPSDLVKDDEKGGTLAPESKPKAPKRVETKAAARPKPAAAPRRPSSTMTEAEAEEKRIAAVKLMRQDQEGACAMLESIIAQTARDSDAHERAQALHDRKCE